MSFFINRTPVNSPEMIDALAHVKSNPRAFGIDPDELRSSPTGDIYFSADQILRAVNRFECNPSSLPRTRDRAGYLANQLCIENHHQINQIDTEEWIRLFNPNDNISRGTVILGYVGLIHFLRHSSPTTLSSQGITVHELLPPFGSTLVYSISQNVLLHRQ